MHDHVLDLLLSTGTAVHDAHVLPSNRLDVKTPPEIASSPHVTGDETSKIPDNLNIKGTTVDMPLVRRAATFTSLNRTRAH